MIYVTGRRLSNGGTKPSHITHLRVTESDGSEPKIWTKQFLVDWIDGTDGTGRTGIAKVRNAFGVDVTVRTVHPTGAPAYVQTNPDNMTTDNLLSLPPC